MPVHPPVVDDHMTLQEAVAAGYGSYNTLRKYIRQGDLPAIKVRNRVYVAADDLDAFVAPVSVPRAAQHAAMDVAIERVVALAPRLTADQRARLATVVGGAR